MDTASSEPLVRVLLISADPATVAIARDSLLKLGVAVEVVAGVEQSFKRIAAAKFEGVVVDTQVPGHAQILHAIQTSRSNNKSVIFAVLGDVDIHRNANELGVAFVLQKPLASEDTTNVFRGAFSLMLRERRRYFRSASRFPVQVVRGGLHTWSNSVNISEGGMGIESLPSLDRGTRVQLRWHLPGRSDEFVMSGQVSWQNSSGRCGLQFADMPKDQKTELQKWLVVALHQATSRLDQ